MHTRAGARHRRYLAAKCLAEVEEWDECLTLLGDGELDDDMQDVSGGRGAATHAHGFTVATDVHAALADLPLALTPTCHVHVFMSA
jgi:hypothetical protein